MILYCIVFIAALYNKISWLTAIIVFSIFEIIKLIKNESQKPIKNAIPKRNWIFIYQTIKTYFQETSSIYFFIEDRCYDVKFQNETIDVILNGNLCESCCIGNAKRLKNLIITGSPVLDSDFNYPLTRQFLTNKFNL